MRALTLKAAATALTAAAAVGAAIHVSGNVRNHSAALHPEVLGARTATSQGGGLSLTPSVRAGAGVQPVTSTYVS